jgi:hypothetical protein
MIPNNSEQFQLHTTQIGVPPTGNVPTPQVGQPPTLYDYWALLPALITAATPLLLGLNKKGKDEGKNKDD